jgi:hypothetical protein
MKTMRTRSIIILILTAFMISSCAGAEQTAPQPAEENFSFEFFRDGYYQAVLPTWDEAPEVDPEALYTVMKDGQFISINRYQNIPEIFADQFLTYIEEDDNAFLVQQGELEGRPFFEFTTREDNQTMRLQAVLDYCQGQTYALVVGGRDTVENSDLFQQVLTSTSCQDEFRVPDLETGKIGLMVNPAEDDFWQGYYPALRLAKENGVQVLHSYILWGEVEKEPGEWIWEWQDALMGYRFHEGFEVSLVVNVIHTALRGSMPEDLKDKAFDDPEFIERFTDFILEVLERYPVHYLSIGNEVNDYFVSHRDEIPAYQTFFLEVQSAIKEEYPDLKVGMTFAYHDAETSNSIDIIRDLDLGDFLPLTLYLYNPGFQFDRDPAELAAYFDRILALAGENPVAFAEIGWNTSPSLSGTQEDQEKFVREAFRLLSLHRDQIEFISWFDLHDSKLENSYQLALTFIPKDSGLIQDEAYMTIFVDFLNYHGLLENDGTPKLGWYAFQEEASSYLESIP